LKSTKTQKEDFCIKQVQAAEFLFKPLKS